MGHSMEFQRAPSYTSEYEHINPRWDAVLRRSVSAVIPPELSDEGRWARRILRRRAPPGGTAASVGPGVYDEDDHFTQRLRPDVAVLPWARSRKGLPEHIEGLFGRHYRRGRLRLDRRSLLDFDADVALRRRHAGAIIRPLSEPPPRRSWSAGDVWRLYDPVLAPEPPGLASFSRWVDFELWRGAEEKWAKLEAKHMHRTYPNLPLAYSLPDLETTKVRAPSVDFTHTQGRPASDAGAEAGAPEGDVLWLDLGLEKEVVHPRVPAVDMARQLGRRDLHPREDVDDFEELVLTPRPTLRQTPCFVDMGRAQGRPEALELDAHVWSEDARQGVLSYQPTSGLACGREPDELYLDPLASERRLRPASTSGADFARPLGRPGVDPRMSDVGAWASGWFAGEEALLTNWQEPFRDPPVPHGLPLQAADEAPDVAGGGSRGGGAAVAGHSADTASGE